jgi:hypothetical protein
MKGALLSVVTSVGSSPDFGSGARPWTALSLMFLLSSLPWCVAATRSVWKLTHEKIAHVAGVIDVGWLENGVRTGSW